MAESGNAILLIVLLIAVILFVASRLYMRGRPPPPRPGAKPKGPPPGWGEKSVSGTHEQRGMSDGR